jgi:hypothetical protein
LADALGATLAGADAAVDGALDGATLLGDGAAAVEHAARATVASRTNGIESGRRMGATSVNGANAGGV